MKKRLLIRGMVMMVILTLAGMFLPAHQVAYAISGSGTEGDPYIITTVAELETVTGSSWYELGNNIDASSTYPAGFNPIGIFSGHFDGKGYVISDLYINKAGLDNQGLFVSNTGTIQNVGVENATLIADEKSGILVAKNDGGVISQCYVTGSVALDGSKQKSDGGLVGNNKGTISNCYSTASVTGIEKLGGFDGKQEAGTLTNCYSAGAVTGSTSAFGFTGEVKNVVETTYSDCFWDTQTSGCDTDAATGQLSAPTGKTTAQMKQQATFTNWTLPMSGILMKV